jgi:hypothetical protein
MNLFAKTVPAFAAFLETAKDNADLGNKGGGSPTNARFIPRNFLLDERIADDRLKSYIPFLNGIADWNLELWDAAHKNYLKRFVFVTPSAEHDPRFVAIDEPRNCPETFRSTSALQTFQTADRQTHFIRIVPVKDIAQMADEDVGYVWNMGEAWVRDRQKTNPARNELARILDQAAHSDKCDHRPVFAAFYEDLADELKQSDWPDRLRNRLGLYHINQWNPPGLPARVFLFRYPVEDLPRKRGETERRPLAVPSVLDHRFSEAFCPAPSGLNRGRLVNLKAGENIDPAREVLHFFMPFQAEHLFLVGEVTTPVPENLGSIRRDHLLWLQLTSGREDYASETDADLLQIQTFKP